jgi:hypothetical protein
MAIALQNHEISRSLAIQPVRRGFALAQMPKARGADPSSGGRWAHTRVDSATPSFIPPLNTKEERPAPCQSAWRFQPPRRHAKAPRSLD